MCRYGYYDSKGTARDVASVTRVWIRDRSLLLLTALCLERRKPSYAQGPDKPIYICEIIDYSLLSIGVPAAITFDVRGSDYGTSTVRASRAARGLDCKNVCLSIRVAVREAPVPRVSQSKLVGESDVQ